MSGDIKAAQKQLTDKVMGRDGVTGTAIGQKGGRPCLKVYVRDLQAGKSVPSSVAGFPVFVEVTGGFRRL